MNGDLLFRVAFLPARVVHHDDGSISFPDGGTVVFGDAERRIWPGDALALRVNKDGSATMMINHEPVEGIKLDS